MRTDRAHVGEVGQLTIDCLGIVAKRHGFKGRRGGLEGAPAGRVGQHLFCESEALCDCAGRDQRGRLRPFDRSNDGLERKGHPGELQRSFRLPAVSEDDRPLARPHLHIDAVHAGLEREVRQVVVQGCLHQVPVTDPVPHPHQGQG